MVVPGHNLQAESVLKGETLQPLACLFTTVYLIKQIHMNMTILLWESGSAVNVMEDLNSYISNQHLNVLHMAYMFIAEYLYTCCMSRIET